MPLTADRTAISIESLTFRYQAPNCPPGPNVLHDVQLILPRSAICVLIGANGAGKSTLLSILAGKKLVRKGVKVLDFPVFFTAPEGITYLGTEWATNPIVRSDLEVGNFLESVGCGQWPERRDHLLNLLDVDLKWRMHQVSDGERRRVQLVAGLTKPFKVLLLDEVTVDLDVLVRSNLLDFLKGETEGPERATILYATHILDGLDPYPTHICHMSEGSTIGPSPIPWPPAEDATPEMGGIQESERTGSKLLALSLRWLREDRARRGDRRSAAPAHPETGATAKKEEFFGKYDYSK